MLKFFGKCSIIVWKVDLRGKEMTAEHLGKIFSNIPTMATERLVMRDMRVGDCFDMYEYAKNSEVTKYLTWSPHPDLEYTKQYLNSLKYHYEMGMFYDWALILASENKMIGTCGFTRFNLANNSAEIGYVINPSFHGKGIAVEAARKVLEFGFDNLGLNRVEAKYIIGNDPSRRVMEKLGMTFEGVARRSMCVKGVYRDIGTCAILREEFKF